MMGRRVQREPEDRLRNQFTKTHMDGAEDRERESGAAAWAMMRMRMCNLLR